MNYTIKHVCEELHLTVHTVRHYCDMGLVPNLTLDKNEVMYGTREDECNPLNW